MLSWQIWLIISGFCFILEIITVGFLMFWFAIAALITCLLSFFIQNVVIQTGIFLILSILLISLTRQFAKKINKNDNSKTNANAFIGKIGIVIKEINSSINQTGQINISGDIWTAITENYNNPIPIGAKVKVLKIDGVKLIVEPLSNKTN